MTVGRVEAATGVAIERESTVGRVDARRWCCSRARLITAGRVLKPVVLL